MRCTRRWCRLILAQLPFMLVELHRHTSCAKLCKTLGLARKHQRRAACLFARARAPTRLGLVGCKPARACPHICAQTGRANMTIGDRGQRSTTGVPRGRARERGRVGRTGCPTHQLQRGGSAPSRTGPTAGERHQIGWDKKVPSWVEEGVWKRVWWRQLAPARKSPRRDAAGAQTQARSGGGGGADKRGRGGRVPRRRAGQLARHESCPPGSNCG